MKKQTTLLFGILVATMSSCVYSLFPIYTDDTLVFKEELLGKWMIGDDSYLLFETVNNKKDESSASEKKEYKYSIEINEGFTMSSDEPIFIQYKGKNIYNEDSIRMIMQERMSKSGNTEESKEGSVDFKEIAKEQIKEDKLGPNDIEYSGSVSVYEEKSYKVTAVSEGGEKQSFLAHLVEIGGDLFMDLYPVKEFDSKNISDNFFPVHTFYKIKVTKTEFTMTHFDLDKLNKLFKSNLIRLRHENVDGTILITAQPKELQKFIDTYSDDESVFDFTETYKKAI